MEDPKTRRTVAYVGETTDAQGERVVALRSPRNARHLYFHYHSHRVFPDSEDSEGEEEEGGAVKKFSAVRNKQRSSSHGPDTD